MKFGHNFKASLATQDFPPQWVEQAIPYGQLKKCLRKVQSELLEIGLDPDTLRALLEPQGEGPPALRSMLRSSADSEPLQPKLVLHVELRDGVVTDASLAPQSRKLLEAIARNLSSDRKPCHGAARDLHQAEDPLNMIPPALSSAPETDTRSRSEMIQVPLVFGSEFFDILQNDVLKLDELQAKEGRKMNAEIESLGEEVSQACQTNRFSKSDLARWRQIFELYLDAQIFFATHEQDHGSRTGTAALKQLQWFQTEIEKRRLIKQFKVRESRVAYSRFLRLNAILLKNLQFRELNALAVQKILKKFDKRTALRTVQGSPGLLWSDRLLSENIAKDVCARMSRELVAIVPQLSDHSCPICISVPWRPVRLACQHVFCIRCMVKMQRSEERHCPLCRADVVMNACVDNIDLELEKYLKKYFPKEVKEKQRANEVERAIEDYGAGHVSMGCSTM